MVTDVFEQSAGLSLLGWRAARLVYRLGGRGGAAARLYSTLRGRTDLDRPGPPLRIMVRSVRRRFLGRPDPLVVEHPTLVAGLKGKEDLVYQHGEIAVPPEALVRGNHRVLVPCAAAADRFLRGGFPGERIFVSGLCIESGLVDQARAAFDSRLLRLAEARPLVGAFYSSGAEPAAHVCQLVRAARSAVESGGRAIVFAREAGGVAAQVRRALAGRGGAGLAALKRRDGADVCLPSLLLCTYRSRADLNRQTQGWFGSFDYLVAPSHERSQWALGLGLPMFVLDPPIGTFAPLNREALLAAGVARPADGSGGESFGAALERLRQRGELERMAAAGWGRLAIDGFRQIARFLGTAC
jgi:hypothetical protein